jgi:hypothetical protein
VDDIEKQGSRVENSDIVKQPSRHKSLLLLALLVAAPVVLTACASDEVTELGAQDGEGIAASEDTIPEDLPADTASRSVAEAIRLALADTQAVAAGQPVLLFMRGPRESGATTAENEAAARVGGEYLRRILGLRDEREIHILPLAPFRGHSFRKRETGLSAVVYNAHDVASEWRKLLTYWFFRRDLFLTGGMRHHDLLAKLLEGASVVLCEHSSSERGYLPRLAERLQQSTADRLEVLVASSDVEPIRSV